MRQLPADGPRVAQVRITLAASRPAGQADTQNMAVTCGFAMQSIRLVDRWDPDQSSAVPYVCALGWIWLAVLATQW
jgi:hypothetical protein